MKHKNSDVELWITSFISFNPLIVVVHIETSPFDFLFLFNKKKTISNICQDYEYYRHSYLNQL